MIGTSDVDVQLIASPDIFAVPVLRPCLSPLEVRMALSVLRQSQIDNIYLDESFDGHSAGTVVAGQSGAGSKLLHP